jgi:dipeptidyl aminopeptidase/acylaminoacyl peptidase
MIEDRSFTVDALLELPRLSELTLSPDGSRLVVSVARSDKKGKQFVSALYEINLQGVSRPRRLTRPAPGKSSAAFAPDGSLLFTSPVPNAEQVDGDSHGEVSALWRLSAGGGETYLLARPPGGVEMIAVAREAGTTVFASPSYPSTGSWEEDAERERARRDADVEAQLFTEYPIRFWNHYLGPRERHLYLVPLPKNNVPVKAGKDLIPYPGHSLDATDFLNTTSFVIAPDGTMVVTNRWREDVESHQRFLELVAIDTASGKTWTLAGGKASYRDLACSPDGRWIVTVREGLSTPEHFADSTLWLIDLKTGEGRDLLKGFDRWPKSPVWAPDSNTIFFTADDDGNEPIFRVDTNSGAVTRLSGHGAYTSLCVSPDGQTLYALRSTVSDPPYPVALDTETADAEPRRLRSFEELDGLRLKAQVERVSAMAEDGTPVRSWLLLPPGASAEAPAPLAVSIHGGPLTSWSSWHWRSNPHVFVEDGWAVLLSDPAVSTGYGVEYIRRGWGRWGDVVYGDTMSALEAAVNRNDIDAERTVAMGSSFGGYMVNWIAGHTDRFRALVAHAGVWDLESYYGTTDLGWWWEREFGNPYEDDSRYRENNPRLHVREITTPMLVIHGERDYRVSVSETLRLWTDLKRNGVTAKFLYFPDEHHWITKPNNIHIWYETILSFIDYYARGQKWRQPELLQIAAGISGATHVSAYPAPKSSRRDSYF